MSALYSDTFIVYTRLYVGVYGVTLLELVY